jgi:hypothetical protein
MLHTVHAPQGGITVLFRRTEADGPHYYLVWAASVATLTTNASSRQATVTAPARILGHQPIVISEGG